MRPEGGEPDMSLRIVFQKQKPMRQVLIALTPAWIGSIFFYGWVSAFMVLLSMTACTAAEWLFVRRRDGKVSEAALVTGMLYGLILPPTLPWPMIVLGAMFGIVFGKMAFGGFGANVFNPAMVGRAFVYITFPVHMTNRWIPAANFSDFPAGFLAWRTAPTSGPLSAVTAATPSHAYTAGKELAPGFLKLFLGHINGTFESLGQQTLIGGGSLGEGSALLLLIGGVYLLFKKTARWQLTIGFLGTYFLFQSVLWLLNPAEAFDPIFALFSGGAILGGFFMVTDPVSAVKTQKARWFYSGLIAVLTVLIRSYSLFAGGLMFSILLGNMFGPLMDVGVRAFESRRSGQ